MIQVVQLRAARALLGWRQEDLARAAGIGLATVQRIEQADGLVAGNVKTVWQLQAALQRAGIRFIGGAPDDREIGVSKQILAA
jgi:transcriptional regulator with XRE-family HTH domain